ncbi:MBL fold metallo-hydrolase [Egibacter rhizosphaerae]|uniref:MBL fold metallo-hydrolase n=1 Tax=Egibacter rhizosphaerae TaxID=1670831 RepID=A0A411YK38_9ACTN|nr:MBL fold metallo-hydrolase [Egibacter rhizosphaerae]QBI21579.1 MBL fold metallo-hydrolase [Egibacter rhizosphaerae]
MAGTTEALPAGIRAIDTHTAGMTQVTAGYLIEAPRPALIECGPALSVDNVISALRELGMDPDDLAYLVLSHIHLDHAGGAGDVAAAFPNAHVVVSEVGARHLVDPEKLNASSRRVYGELMDTVYGDCTPVEQPRVLGVGDGDVLDLGGGRRLDLLYTPGHAKHHISAFDRDSGSLFVGDSVGVKMPGMRVIRPATPPPDFDLVLAQRTLTRYRGLAPARVYLAHYGPVDPADEALAEASERLAAWFETAEAAWREHSELDHIAETLAYRFADDVVPDPDDPDAERRVRLLSGFESNAAGLMRYLDLRAEGRVTAAEDR